MTRMTSNGQVTISKRIRDKLGLGSGGERSSREEGQSMIVEGSLDVEKGSAAVLQAWHQPVKVALAIVQGYRFLTCEAARIRTYVLGVDIIAPDTHP
jgi:hypothetical protein